MSAFSITKLTGLDATGAGGLLVANAAGVAAPPPGADASYGGMFESLLARARVAQDALFAAVGAVTTAEDAHTRKVAAARAEEKALDDECSAIHIRLRAAVKARDPGAQELLDLSFRDGLAALTRPSGRPQLALYLAWLQVLSSAAATSNPAYALIADMVAAFRAQAETFSRTIQEKDSLDASLTAARTARDKAQGEWTGAFGILIEMAAHTHGEDSDAFRGWIRPLLDWKATQDAARTRRANAQDDAPPPEPAVTPAPPEGPTGEGGQGAG